MVPTAARRQSHQETTRVRLPSLGDGFSLPCAVSAGSHSLKYAASGWKMPHCIIAVEGSSLRPNTAHRTPLYQGLRGSASLCCARLAGNSLLPTFLLSQPQKPGRADLDLAPPDLPAQRETNTARDPDIGFAHLKELGSPQYSAHMHDTL
jgi:hypothetical protein